MTKFRSVLKMRGAPGLAPTERARTWGTCQALSLYRKPATTAARMAPPHRSSIHPNGKTRGTGDHAAWARLLGNPARNPATMPIFRAVLKPGPAVARLQA